MENFLWVFLCVILVLDIARDLDNQRTKDERQVEMNKVPSYREMFDDLRKVNVLMKQEMNKMESKCAVLSAKNERLKKIANSIAYIVDTYSLTNSLGECDKNDMILLLKELKKECG